MSIEKGAREGKLLSEELADGALKVFRRVSRLQRLGPGWSDRATEIERPLLEATEKAAAEYRAAVERVSVLRRRGTVKAAGDVIAAAAILRDRHAAFFAGTPVAVVATTAELPTVDEEATLSEVFDSGSGPIAGLAEHKVGLSQFRHGPGKVVSPEPPLP